MSFEKLIENLSDVPKFKDLLFISQKLQLPPGLQINYTCFTVALVWTPMGNTNIDLHIDLDEKHFSPIILSDMDMFHGSYSMYI